MTGSHRRQVGAWLVLLVAIGAMLGHVCMLPLHAHAEDVASRSHAEHHDSDDAGEYHASCEALRTAPAQVPQSVLTGSTFVAPLPPLARQAFRVPGRLVRSESPPLFLLHAALLI